MKIMLDEISSNWVINSTKPSRSNNLGIAEFTKAFTNQLNHRTCKECVDGLNYLYISLLNQNQYSKPTYRPIDDKYPIYEHEYTIHWRPHVNKLATWFSRFPKPMRKLSGLISRWRNDLEWTNSTRLIWKKKKNSFLKD